jgi:hypothetical protein
MILNLSLAADDPKNVAGVLAELWRGISTPFPGVIEGAWLALADDDRSNVLVVYPRGTALFETEGDADAHGEEGPPVRRHATHIGLATPLESDEVLALARREGWPAKLRKAGGVFSVIELWIEGTQLVQVHTPSMLPEYLLAMCKANWTALVEGSSLRFEG